MASSVTVADALAAIRQYLADNWNATPIVFENEDPADPTAPWPPVDPTGLQPVPWIFCEIVPVDPLIVGFGKPGDQTIREDGLIKLYVMVQKGSGMAVARTHATAAGEVFRQKLFFTTDSTAGIRTKTPRVGRDPLTSDDGNVLAGASVTIPYEFTHQA